MERQCRSLSSAQPWGKGRARRWPRVIQTKENLEAVAHGAQSLCHREQPSSSQRARFCRVAILAMHPFIPCWKHLVGPRVALGCAALRPTCISIRQCVLPQVLGKAATVPQGNRSFRKTVPA